MALAGRGGFRQGGGAECRLQTTSRLWAEFPGRREKCREFRRFSRFFRKFVSKTSANSAVCEIIPYALEQGIYSRVQGIILTYSTAAGICVKSIPEPEYPIASKCRARPVFDCRLARGPERPRAQRLRKSAAWNFLSGKRNRAIVLPCPLNDPERFGRTRRALRAHGEAKNLEKDLLVWILLQVLEIPQNRQRNLWKSLEKSG